MLPEPLTSLPLRSGALCHHLPQNGFLEAPTLLIPVFQTEIPHGLVESWSHACALFAKAAEHQVSGFYHGGRGEEQTDTSPQHTHTHEGCIQVAGQPNM